MRGVQMVVQSSLEYPKEGGSATQRREKYPSQGQCHADRHSWFSLFTKKGVFGGGLIWLFFRGFFVSTRWPGAFWPVASRVFILVSFFVFFVYFQKW